MKHILFGNMLFMLSAPAISFGQIIQTDYPKNPELQKTEIGFSQIIFFLFL
jgi:hypothetical protein